MFYSRAVYFTVSYDLEGYLCNCVRIHAMGLS